MAPLVRRSWSPRGHTPVLTQRGRSRRKVSVIGALVISPKRQRVRGYFRLHPDANLDGPLVRSFLRELLRTLRVPLELIWDRLNAHRGEPVKSFLQHERRRLHVHLLPPYAPELSRQIWAPRARVAALALRKCMPRLARGPGRNRYSKSCRMR
jgi:DDE superfamily endonuclease